MSSEVARRDSSASASRLTSSAATALDPYSSLAKWRSIRFRRLTRFARRTAAIALAQVLGHSLVIAASQGRRCSIAAGLVERLQDFPSHRTSLHSTSASSTPLREANEAGGEVWWPPRKPSASGQGEVRGVLGEFPCPSSVRRHSYSASDLAIVSTSNIDTDIDTKPIDKVEVAAIA